MYEHFFGLVEKPFCVTPDTHYLYPSPQHEGVIHTLTYGIKERKGFLMLTGEVGTGKTTSIRSLLNRLNFDTQTSVIFNPLLSTEDLVKSVNRDFGCLSPQEGLAPQLEALNQYLLENDRKGHNALVIIDEAQNMPLETLEMARLLSNLETETHKLLQILLVGQPELEEKLKLPILRQLSQRIQVHVRLTPLDKSHTENYVRYRLERAGNKPHVAFEKKALIRVHKITGGIPRKINTLCDLALLAAYTNDEKIITKRLVDKAAKEAPFHVHHS